MGSNSKMVAMSEMGQAAREAGLITSRHLNAPRLQKGGRPSKSGGIMGGERLHRAGHINAPHNAKEWPSHGVMRGSNRGQKTGIQGGVQGSNGNGPPNDHYSAGNGRRFG